MAAFDQTDFSFQRLPLGVSEHANLDLSNAPGKKQHVWHGVQTANNG